MITGEQKPIEKIREMIAPYKRILVVGCGSCVAECPGRAIQLMHYTDLQTLTKVDALFDKDHMEIDIIPIDEIGVLSTE